MITRKPKNTNKKTETKKNDEKQQSKIINFNKKLKFQKSFKKILTRNLKKISLKNAILLVFLFMEISFSPELSSPSCFRIHWERGGGSLKHEEKKGQTNG